MIKKLVQFLKGEEGATAVEYAVMVALIALIVIVGAQLLGTNTNAVFERAASTIGANPVTP